MYYRIYPLSAIDRYGLPLGEERASDVEAIAWAVSVGADTLEFGCDIWQLDRFVVRLKPDPDRRLVPLDALPAPPPNRILQARNAVMDALFGRPH